MQFLNSLPSTLSDFGLDLEEIGLNHFAHELSFPTQLRQFVDQLLAWNPCARLTAASASQHALLTTPCLSACVSMRQDRDGPCSISSGFLLDEVADLRAECRVTHSSMIEARPPRRLTLEVVAHAENEPPACNRFNSDMNLRIRSERIASFTRALRRCARGWFQQLQERVHAEILRVASVELINFCPFMHEDFPDFGYASVELINFEGQEGTWHTDGGASLLDAVVTIFGSHDLVVEASLHASGVTYAQQPGSFYVGNPSALEHRRLHRAGAPGSLGGGPTDHQEHISIMLRSSFFRELRDCISNKGSYPEECFDIVRRETARHVAQVPFPQPDLPAVVAECTQVIFSSLSA